MIASEAQQEAGASIGREFLAQVEALYAAHLAAAPDDTARVRMLAQGAMQILVGVLSGREDNGSFMMQGMGAALGAFLCQCEPADQALAIRSFEAGINFGATLASRDFKPAGRA